MQNMNVFILNFFTEMHPCPGGGGAGIYGKWFVRVNSFSESIVISIVLDASLNSLPRLCLLLISVPDIADDFLYLEEGKTYFARCYPTSLTETEFSLLFKQQIVIAETLNRYIQSNALPSAPDIRSRLGNRA